MWEGNTVAVDVICQHSRDGTLIPLKVRVTDEEGEYQTYYIKGYKDHSHQGSRTLPTGVFVTNNTIVFECEIISFGRKRKIWLYYEESHRMVWTMSA